MSPPLGFIAVWIIFATFTMGESQRFRGKLETCENLNAVGKEYRRDLSDGRCYQVGTRGPCGELMTFYINPQASASLYGFCDCDQGHVDKQSPCKDSPIRRRIYIQKYNRCFTVFSQGPCKDGEWLILIEKTNQASCVHNPCQDNGDSRDISDQFWFYEPTRKQCYQSFTQGYCSSGMHLELVHDSQYPQCKRPSCSGSLAYGISLRTTCQAGNRYSYLTRSCRRLYRIFPGIG